MIYEVKAKKQFKDREFILLWDNDESATVEFDNWNRCSDNIYKKFKNRKDLVFKEAGEVMDELNQMSIPMNRGERENLSMARFKRQVNIEGRQ